MNQTLVEEAPVAARAACPQRTVLLIDDEIALSLGISKILARQGFTTYRCTNGAEALQLLRTQPVDVVLTDIYMAEMDGFEVITQIRTQYPGLPVIAMSGGGRGLGMSCLSIAHKLGAVVTLQKPLDLDVLVNELHRLADSSPH